VSGCLSLHFLKSDPSFLSNVVTSCAPPWLLYSWDWVSSSSYCPQDSADPLNSGHLDFEFEELSDS
jgi:hypothetical protein